ncbi:MAG: hypothetical protein L0216_00505 [Planctomycetales bacterium]|nr:hypothetical protein [Planctomycetales bacterium]
MDPAPKAPAPPAPAEPRRLSRLALAAYIVSATPVGFLGLPLGAAAWIRLSRGGAALAGLPLAIGAMALGLVWAVGLTGILILRLTGAVAANEKAALEELRMIREGERAFREAAVVDQDKDGRGEFGLFTELASGPHVRHGFLRAPGPGRDWISRIFYTQLEPSGIVRKYGYCFILFLPGADGMALTSGQQVPAGQPAAADRQEREMVCYAWPEVHGKTGVLAYVLDGEGRIWACTNGRWQYSGSDKGPAPAAAWPGMAPPMTFPPAGIPPGAGPGGPPRDGEDWHKVE